MVYQVLSSKAHCLVGLYGAVCCKLDGKLVVVCNLTYTGVNYFVANLLYRCEDRVDGNPSDFELLPLLILVSRVIAPALFDFDIHDEPAALAYCGNVEVGIDDCYVCVVDKVAGCYLALAYCIDVQCTGLVGKHAEAKLLDVKYNLGNVLFYALDCGELVQYAVNADGCSCRSGKRG